MQYLIGLGLPGFAGTGLFGEGVTCVDTCVAGCSDRPARYKPRAVARNSFLARQIDDTQRAGKQLADVLRRRLASSFCRVVGPCGFAFEIRPLPLATSSCLPSGRHAHRGRIPAHRDESERPALARRWTHRTPPRCCCRRSPRTAAVSSGDNARLFGVEPGRRLRRNEA